MKVYEDKGPKGQNEGRGAVFVGGAGAWRQVPPNKYKNDRAILVAAFGPIIPLFSSDIGLVREMCIGQ